MDEILTRANDEKEHQWNIEQRGAVEACWAHNPEVGGSKPLAAKVEMSSTASALF
uniref:Uncharacterized protein n=1 Tax=Setaria digitata TaxID=48799 RepID=A0A915Q6G4_9BILA